MLESMYLKNVGPAPEMELRLAQRLNLITGDNGLGKSFLLDIAWWALTRTWARYLVLPSPSQGKPRIAYSYTKSTPRSYSYESRYDRKAERWSVNNGRPAIPGLVLYAQVDGGFSVWDPARNYWKTDAPDRPNSYLFAPHEVWEGNAHCEGLILDVKKDAWFDLDLEEARVVLRKRQFVRRGEVSNWLTSEAFDLRKARSLEAESAIETALALLRQKDPPWQDVESADQGLHAAGLPDIDPFWVRWGQFVEERKPAKRGKR